MLTDYLLFSCQNLSFFCFPILVFLFFFFSFLWLISWGIPGSFGKAEGGWIHIFSADATSWCSTFSVNFLPSKCLFPPFGCCISVLAYNKFLEKTVFVLVDFPLRDFQKILQNCISWILKLVWSMHMVKTNIFITRLVMESEKLSDHGSMVRSVVER